MDCPIKPPTDDSYTIAQIAGTALTIGVAIKSAWLKTAGEGIYKERTDKKNR
jgi:hypothetical protein